MNIKTEKPLVSIITPCYNGEKYVHRFLDSVLTQTYSNLELIIINDGSKDKTEEIVLSYQSKFNEKGIDFKYIYQENKGQAAALNQGLKIFKGEYLTWPDSDDILHEDNINDRVTFLENNREYNVVLSESVLVNSAGEEIGRFKRIPPNISDDIFSDLILEKNVYFAGGAYMLRSTAFIEAVPDRSIYESRGGQNWQMLLPVLYSNKCGYLKKALYYIYERQGSHSRELNDVSGFLSRCDEHEDLLLNTICRISQIPQEERECWSQIIKNKYLKKRLRIASQYRSKDILEELDKEIKRQGVHTFRDAIVYYSGKYTSVYYMQTILKFPIRLLRKVKRRL